MSDEALRARSKEFYQRQGRRAMTRTGSPVDDIVEFVKSEQANMVRTDKLIVTLSRHYLMGVVCDHEKGTDRAQCYCTVWRGSEMANVEGAIAQWILHVLEELSK